MSQINTRLISGSDINKIVPELIPPAYLHLTFECYPTHNNKRIAAIIHNGSFAFEIGDKLSSGQFNQFVSAGTAHVSDYDEFSKSMF